MSSGDPVKAGNITTAYATTDVVAEPNWDNYHRTEFNGSVIFRVGPSNDAKDNRVPEATLDGVQGLGLWGGTGVIGLGGQIVDARSAGIGVLGVGGRPEAGIDLPDPGGIGVKGIAGGTADGVVGLSDAHFRSGVFGFNSLSLQINDVAGFGVFGRCDAAGGAGVGAESKFGVGARAHSAENDGVVGLSDGQNKSGVLGFNSREEGVGYGLFGRCDANGGAGVGAESSLGVGVRGHSRFNDAVVGLSDAKVKSGVYGFNSNTSGKTFGVFGRANSPEGAAVAGASDHGYGASFRGGLAPLRIEPAGAKGAPATGNHQTGEFFVDSLGDLYFCKIAGVGPAAKWVKLTP